MQKVKRRAYVPRQRPLACVGRAPDPMLAGEPESFLERFRGAGHLICIHSDPDDFISRIVDHGLDEL
ncbi:hypothetical protein NFJ07_25735, partial [Arthrobacter sp. B2a2-09]